MKRDDIKNFYKGYAFSVKGSEDKLREDIEDLNRVLSSFGLSAKYLDRTLLINIDSDEYLKKSSRNAGRRKNYARAFDYNMNPTIQEVFEMQERMTNAQIIEQIGCPRATFYRALKNAKDLVEHDDSYRADYFLAHL